MIEELEHDEKLKKIFNVTAVLSKQCIIFFFQFLSMTENEDHAPVEINLQRKCHSYGGIDAKVGD